MTEPETPDIDRRLRDAFADDARAAARVARGALAEEDARAGRAAGSGLKADAPRTRRRWAIAAAGAALVVVASALALWPVRPQPEPASEPTAAPMLSGVLTDGALVISLPDGSTSISWGGARDDRPPDGSGIVLVEGVIR